MVVADAEELLKSAANRTGEQIASVHIRAGEPWRSAKARLTKVQATLIDRMKWLPKLPTIRRLTILGSPHV